MENIYVFYVTDDDCLIYERTCGNEERAIQRCDELKKYYKDAKYFTDIKGLKFYY